MDTTLSDLHGLLSGCFVLLSDTSIFILQKGIGSAAGEQLQQDLLSLAMSFRRLF